MRDRRLFLAFLALAGCALAASGCSVGDDAATATAGQVAAKPAASRPTAVVTDTAKLARERRRPAVELARPRRGYPVLFVRRGRRVPLRTSPGGQVFGDLEDRTEFGSPQVLSVVRWTHHWAAVETPYLANDQTGWVRLDPRVLGVYSTPWAVVVHTATRQAEVLRGDRVMRRFAVSVGAPQSPTPTGRFAITDTFRGGLSTEYGCCALALTAHQPYIPSGWLGGNRIAIHGTYGPVGYAISHGCIRASNVDVAALIRQVPIGSPVVVRE